MTLNGLVKAYNTFRTRARPFINIENEEEYNEALDALEKILETTNDSVDEPLNPLIDMLSNAIERYENKDEELMAFVAEAEGLPADIALLKTIMANYGLTGSDLPEIGDRSMVSKVLKGTRSLSRPAIEKLSSRFGLKPSMFFDE